MAASANVVYVETYGEEFTMSQQEVEHRQIRGFALVVVGLSQKYAEERQVVRVVFRQVPGGRIEDGDVQIDRIELAVWDTKHPPIDTNNEALSQGVIGEALIKGVADFVKRKNQAWLDSRWRPPTK